MTIAEALKPLDSAIWEMGEAFEGLRDADVWTRPHPRLLSVGELAAHIAYGELRSILGEFDSPFADPAASYYLSSVETPWSLPMSASEVLAEVRRVHDACKAYVLEAQPELDSASPHREGWTWSYVLEYMAFHIAYHAGQMYSARHLMGHETANN